MSIDNLTKYKFNEVDSMILARFSYLPFDKIKIKNNDTIEEISQKMVKLDDNEFIYNGDKELIKNLGNSERFKNLITSDFPKTYIDKDEYFVMGDNRVVSNDSRYFGPVEKSKLQGKVSFIIFPFSHFGKIKEKIH